MSGKPVVSLKRTRSAQDSIGIWYELLLAQGQQTIQFDTDTGEVILCGEYTPILIERDIIKAIRPDVRNKNKTLIRTTLGDNFTLPVPYVDVRAKMVEGLSAVSFKDENLVRIPDLKVIDTTSKPGRYICEDRKLALKFAFNEVAEKRGPPLEEVSITLILDMNGFRREVTFLSGDINRRTQMISNGFYSTTLMVDAVREGESAKKRVTGKIYMPDVIFTGIVEMAKKQGVSHIDLRGLTDKNPDMKLSRRDDILATTKEKNSFTIPTL